MLRICVGDREYEITRNYDSVRNIWVKSLCTETQMLILDYTIMWNMVEHNVYNDSFNKSEKTNNCIGRMMEREKIEEEVNYIWTLYTEYNKRYVSMDELYRSYGFGKKNMISLEEVTGLYNSDSIKDKIKLLIYSCYRVRCNLFHGPKSICNLDDQKLLFISMNELLSLICKTYRL